MKILLGLLIIGLSGCATYVERTELRAALNQRDEVLVKIVTAVKDLQSRIKPEVKKTEEKKK
jgi:hypothetical protein